MSDKKLIRINASTSKELTFDETVEQYKKFIYGESKKFFSKLEFDDAYQSGLIGLWKAYKTYDGSVLFLSYAGRCIQNEILMTLRKSNRINEKSEVKQIISFDEPIGFGKDGRAMTVEDLVGEDDSFIEKFEDAQIQKKLLNNLSTRQKEEIECLVFKTISQNELAEKYNSSQSYISRRSKKTLERLRMQYLREARV